MNCFNHIDKSAVGTCKACSKGLCIDCVTDLGHGLACKNSHEEIVETHNTIINSNAKVYSNANKNMMIAPIFYLFMGLVFAGFGLVSRQGFTSLTFILGIGFIAFGLICFVRNRATFNSSGTET